MYALKNTFCSLDFNFQNNGNHGSDIEKRLYDSDCTADWLKAENQKVIEGFGLTDNQVILIDKDYEEAIREVLFSSLVESNRWDYI